ncbi:MAG: SpoIIE family protein phosphatase [Bacteroidales bacterium]|nr:SpoIIE family protein phosphatase [Bacteroidales bacterium]
MNKPVKYLISAFIVSLFYFHAFCQEYRIRHFGVQDDGLPNAFIYTVNQDANGFIWAGTGRGLCRSFGERFVTDIIQDSVARTVIVTSYKDIRGNLWFGTQSGDIISYDGKQSRIYNTGEDIISSVTGFAEIEGVRLIVTTQSNGVHVLDITTGDISVMTGIEKDLYTSLFLSGGTLLLGRQEGLAVYALDNRGEQASLLFEVNELEYSKIQDIQITRDQQAYWIATEDQGIFQLSFTGSQYVLTAVGDELNLGNKNIQSVYEDTEGYLWLSSMRNGVYRLHLSEDQNKNPVELYQFNTDNGLISNSIKEVFQDLEGNIWIATYGEGLNLLIPQAFTIVNFESPGFDNNIQSVYVADDNNIYLGSAEGLFRIPAAMDAQIMEVTGLPDDRITALWQYNQDLLIGTESNGLYALHIPSRVARRIPYNAGSLGRAINSITTDSEHIYLGTRDGIYVLDNNYTEQAHYTTEDGIPHNDVKYVYMSRQQRLLFATRAKGIFYLSGDGEPVNLYPAANAEIDFVSMAEDQYGNLWTVTNGYGVIFFQGDSVHQITENTGLESNYCYSLVLTENNNIWVGHRTAVSRINTETFRVSVYDVNIGITGDCNQNAACIDRSGKALIGTTKGLVMYDPVREETDKQPPYTNITRLLISDQEYDFNEDIILPYGIYKLNIEFIGLDYSDPQSVTYQYKLEGYDLDWSEVTSENDVSYPRIEDGSYTFYLRSFSNEGMTQEVPAFFRIRVKLPFWKTFWFIGLSVIVLFLSVLFYIKVRERKQKQLQEYLETELAARTKEVVDQKEVIEIKNKDITDSINYAKRIQTSMLPPVKILQQYFSGCFVFYSPRDIVSGDFYWFEKINENKFIIVCADSTGHGVPGAFMSMIGSTLIKDICTRKVRNSPSQALRALDTELGKMLNQNLDDGTKPSDGMDIIVCEIDLKTYYVRYASAMRPMIIYRNGEEVFIKGSRSSIGGHYDREDNEFMDEGIQLSKGDIIYMFSDGYSDQFGGPMGKKFKMVRLKNLLQDIHDKSMEEQYNCVSNSFSQWKENYDQVDDVLFMGIKM